MAKKKVIIERVRLASDEFAVVSVSSKGPRHERRHVPCTQCPWRTDVPTGVFPAEAFRMSAPSSYDMSPRTFACHMAKVDNVQTCAGFLMRHGDNNLAVRLSQMKGRLEYEFSDGGFPLYPSYREMAIANGVDPADPVLRDVRANGDPYPQK